MQGNVVPCRWVMLGSELLQLLEKEWRRALLELIAGRSVKVDPEGWPAWWAAVSAKESNDKALTTERHEPRYC